MKAAVIYANGGPDVLRYENVPVPECSDGHVVVDVAGNIIIAGIAVCSRIAAILELVGSTVGMLTGLALGANGVAIYNGLWGCLLYTSDAADE